MKKRSSIIISSIAACAIFASAFVFNGFAFENTNANSAAAPVTNAMQSLDTTNATETQTPVTVQDNNQVTTTSAAKAVNTATPTDSTKSKPLNCPKKKETTSSNNQLTNIKSANLINNLQNAINKANCNKTTAKTRNYSALQEKIAALLNANNVSATSKPTNNTTPTKPTTSKPSTSTPATKPTTKVPTNGDYSAFQKKVVELVNVERSKNGLKPLTMNNELSKVATLKSQDMAKLNYFNHNSPTYGSPFDMMKKYGISYRTAGENIAMGQTTPEQVMQGWMNSPGHRANILKSSFTQIGVGVAKNSSGRLYWTQQFIG